MDKSTFMEKLDNYWYYYKVHTIVAVLAVFALIFFISDGLKQKTPVLNVVLTGQTISEDRLTSLQNEATARFAKGKKQEVSLEFLVLDRNSNSQESMAVLAKITAMVQAKDLDVIVMDRDSFDSYAKQGLFLRLDTINGAPVLKDGKLKFVMSRVDDKEDSDHPYGIDVSNNEILKGTGYDTKGKVLGIAVNTQRMGLVLQFLKWILKL